MILQDQLDNLARLARLNADRCTALADGYRRGEWPDNDHRQQAREEVANHMNQLHDLLQQNCQ